MPPLPKTRLIITENGMRRSHQQIVDGSGNGMSQPMLEHEIDPNVMNVVQPDEDAQ